MAIIASLRNILGNDFNSLSQLSIKNLEDQFSTYDDHIKALKVELTDLKDSSEKNAFQLNNDLLASNEKLKSESETCQRLKAEVTTLEEKISTLRKDITDVQNSHRECGNQISQLQTTIKQISQEKLSMAEVLVRKDEEIKSLEDTMKTTCTQLAAANTAKLDALLKVQDIEIENDNLKHQTNRITQEKELLNEQVTSLNRELSDKSADILRLTKDKSSRALELQTELDLKTQELEVAQTQVSDLRQTIKVKDKRIDSLELKMKEVLDGQYKSEEQFTLEINALTQLANLHKTSLEESQERVSELMKTVEELHGTCQVTVQAREEAELALKEAQDAFADTRKEMAEQLDELKKQLHLAQQQLNKMTVVTEEALEDMFPEAASSNRLLRKGMSLTDMYTTYRRSEEELLTKTQENENLKQELKDLHEELEEREPIIQIRMQELKKATETIAVMHEQMHNTSQYIDKLETERDDAVRLTGYHKREYIRMKQTAEDLATQVQFLLKEVEEAAGRRVMNVPDEQKSRSTSQTSTDLVISEHLVTFKDLKELQEQNQKLLSVTRELGQQLEDKEMQMAQERTKELKEQLDSVMKELEELKEERKVQSGIVESIIQQRDSLRSALLHSSNVSAHEHPSSRGSVLSVSSGSGDQHLQDSVLESERVALQKAEAALRELKEEFNVYKKEAKVNATMLQEENNKLRDSLTEVRLQMAKSSSLLEFTQDRLEQCKSNLEMERKEQKVLRENSQKYSANILQHQQTISMLHKELYSVQEKLSHSEITIQNLKSERDQLKATEVRLLQEREAAKAQHNSQGKVMAHLQAVQNNLERLESEAQVKLSNEIKFLRGERDLLRTQLDQAHEDYVAAVKAWESKLKTIQDKLSEEQEKGIKCREELVDSYANMHSLKMELMEVQGKLKAAEEKISKSEGAEGVGARGLNHLRQQLAGAKTEIQTLQQKLTHAHQNTSHFSSMVDDLNKQLKEAKETSAQSTQKMEAALAEKTIHNKNMLSQITEMSEQQNILSEELFKTTNEKDEQIQNMKMELDKLKHSAQASQQQEALMKQLEQQFQADREEQNKLLKEAQEKYQRELVLHAADSEALMDTRNKTSSLESKLACAEEKCSHLEEMLEELRSAWGQQEETFKSEAQALKQKAQDTDAQCTALHQQLELMSSQLSAMKSTPDWSLVGSSGDDRQEISTGHLQEVIRYLRKDKEIAVAQCSASQSEAKRLQIKLELVEKHLKVSQQELTDERAQNQSQATSELEHRDILKKMELMNLLHESNRCLREEKESISKANVELKEKLQSLQSEIASVSKNSNDLSAQVETLSAENTAVRGEIKKWQARAAALTEQSRRHDPQDFRRMEEENTSLKEQLSRAQEEVNKHLAEIDKQTAVVAELRTELLISRKASEVSISKEAAAQKEMEKLKTESAENNKTTLQVKKIARKYKMQYDELKTKHDQLEASTSASQEAKEASTAAHTAALEQLRTELTQQADSRVKEVQDKAAAETTKLKEDLEKITKSEEQVRSQMAEKDERTRKVVLQAKKKLEILQGERDNAVKNVAETAKEVKELKTRLSSLEILQEENSRLSAQRSHLEARAGNLEKDVKRLRDAKERLEKQLEEMAQRKPVSRPSTSGVPVERASSTIQEPLTANIRPMTPPVVTSGSGVVGLRHTPHPTPAAPRTTPTASIRPMAIGTSSSSSGSSVVATPSSSSSSSSVASATSSVASSSTGGHTTRMVAVPPTTANISSTEGEPVLVSTAHVLPTSSVVPQAAVQPTPAIPALVTPLAPPTPPPSSLTEQASSSSAEAGQDDQRGSHLADGDDDLCVASSSTPSSSSVVPAVVLGSTIPVASTSPQTQVVAPTLKRQREEESVAVVTRDSDPQPDTTGSSAPQLKRVRLAGEAQPQQQQQQTQQPLLMERASVVTSGGGVLSSLPSQIERASSSIISVSSDQMTSSVREEASLGIPQPGPTSSVTGVARQQEDLPPERPGVIVTPEPQPVLLSDNTPGGNTSSHQAQLDLHSHDLQQETQEVPSEETDQSNSDRRHYTLEAKSTEDKESESTVPKISMDDHQEDQSKVFVEEEEFVEENEEEEEDDEGMEEGDGYEDVKMQDEPFSQDEDDMGEEEVGSPIQPDGEDMTEPNSEDQIITDEGDEVEEESQMDAQDVTAASMVPGDTVLVGSSPSSSSCAVRVPSSVDIPSSSVRTEPVAEGSLRTGTPNSFLQQQSPHRPPVLPRVPPRAERLLSNQTPEDGDESIVPSTPTLSVPHRGDGFAEAVSSPHLPPGRFVFTSSVEATPMHAFSQLATQGALGVDDTRMDLSQFDEGSGRSVPTTPLQVSPPADATGVDLPELLLHSQQSSTPLNTVLPSSVSTSVPCVQQQIATTITVTEPVSSTQGIPTITVTGHEEPEEVSQSSNSSSSNGSGAQEPQPIIEEPQGPEDSQAQSPAGTSEGLTITEVVGITEEKGEQEKEAETTASNPEESSENPSTSFAQGPPRRGARKPIVWKASEGSRIGRGTPFSTPSARGNPRGLARGFKSRGGPPGSGPMGRGGWSQRGWRGGSGPGPSQ